MTKSTTKIPKEAGKKMTKVFFKQKEQPDLVKIVGRKTSTMFSLLKSRGLGPTVSAGLKSVKRLWVKNEAQVFVSTEDAANVDWTQIPHRILNPIKVSQGPINIAWIMSPPGAESGGHQNIFRFIKFAEQAGHICTIYIYDSTGMKISVSELKKMLISSDAYADVEAEIVFFDRSVGFHSQTQAVFATGWETAYPAFLAETYAKRFYFVQDFEPSFYPIGSDALLAENTYRFGFHGITAGGWLASTLSQKYGMITDHFDFAVDKNLYKVTNIGPRNEVFFYARPVTPRRAFEFGLLVLTDFAKLRPDVTINLAGWDVSTWNIPFKHNNLSSLPLGKLNEVYNRCAVGLVLSLTNMSLLPLELMSSGVTPVVNEGENNSMVTNNPFIEYVPASPLAIARKMVEVMERGDAIQRSAAMSESVQNVNWEDSAQQFLAAFERAMRG